MKTKTKMVMTEQTIYIAEDGKEFFDEDDCLSHERDLLEKGLEFYTWSLSPGKLSNCRYVKATTPELVDKLMKLVDMEGITSVGIREPGIYMYQCTSPRQWINISQAVDIIKGESQ